MQPITIRLHATDNVIIALKDLPPGTDLPDLAQPLMQAPHAGCKPGGTGHPA